MRQFLFILTACFIPWNTPAQETAEDAAFLEFLNADLKAPAAKDLPTPTPSEAMAMLEKWKAYEAAQTEKLGQNIVAARKIAAEMLSKKALSATALSREGLLKEVDLLQSLPATVPLSSIFGNESARYLALLGVWVEKEQRWSNDFFPDGQAKIGDGVVQWHWIDAEAGVLATGKEWADLLWMEKPGTMRYLNQAWERFVSFKTPAPAPTPIDPVIVKLNADEAAQRIAAAEALTLYRNRVIAWLLDKAKQMPAEQVAELLQEVRLLITTADEQSGSPSKLAGVWQWDQSEIAFQPYGVVMTKAGLKAGRWDWVESDKRHFGVVLNGGKSGADIFMARPPTDPRQTILEVQRLIGGQLTVKRTLP